MILCITTISDSNISRVVGDPPLVFKFIAPDDPTAYERARLPEKKAPSFLGRLFKNSAPHLPDTVPLNIVDTEAQTNDLDKAWHGLHYLLTQTDWEGEAPLNFLVQGGSFVGDLDVGYGPARAYTYAQTKEIHTALQQVDEAWLRARFDPARMTQLEIYPQTIWERDKEEGLDYIIDYFHLARDFIATAVKNGNGVLVYIN